MGEAFRARVSSSSWSSRRKRLAPRLLAVAVVPVSLSVFASSALAANANFVGNWTVSSGAGFTITKENHKTGVCAGRSSLAKSGYKLVDCRVHGSKYSFTITYGSSYKSRNTGTLSGNTLKGTFKDTNGTVESYTAERKH
jgi:hypothetical protein